MKITEQRASGGHYFNIEQDGKTLSVRTEHGYPSELAQEATDLIEKATRYARQAVTIQDALLQLGTEKRRRKVIARNSTQGAYQAIEKDFREHGTTPCAVCLEDITRGHVHKLLSVVGGWSPAHKGCGEVKS